MISFRSLDGVVVDTVNVCMWRTTDGEFVAETTVCFLTTFLLEHVLFLSGRREMMTLLLRKGFEGSSTTFIHWICLEVYGP